MMNRDDVVCVLRDVQIDTLNVTVHMLQDRRANATQVERVGLSIAIDDLLGVIQDLQRKEDDYG